MTKEKLIEIIKDGRYFNNTTDWDNCDKLATAILAQMHPQIDPEPLTIEKARQLTVSEAEGIMSIYNSINTQLKVEKEKVAFWVSSWNRMNHLYNEINTKLNDLK